jgi:hypothetical protein
VVKRVARSAVPPTEIVIQVIADAELAAKVADRDLRHSSHSRVLERVYERLWIEQTQEAFQAFPDLAAASK